jgi:hypothetical protein
MPLAIATQSVQTVPGTGPIALLSPRQERVYFVVCWDDSGTRLLLNIFDDGLEDSAFAVIADQAMQTFLRKDLGALVQGAVFASDGAGDIPAGTVTITEAWLTK